VTKEHVHTTEHTIAVDAPPSVVYRIVADVRRWPHTFGPTVHIERFDEDGDSERIRLWALANGEVRSWTSRRELDPVARRVAFRQEKSSRPVAAMGGVWQIEERANGSFVRLLHDFRTTEEEEQIVAWVNRAVDANSRAELAALKRAAEEDAAGIGTTFSFEDSVEISGPGNDAYDFLYRADLWEQRLPHVTRMELTGDDPNVQDMTMDTRAEDGSTHTTRSIRVCFPHHRIVYKQTKRPPLLAAHTGEWRVTTSGPTATVVSRHTVVLNPEKVTAVLGPSATLAEARDAVQRALSTNSATTLRLTAQHVGSAHRVG
jgi:aromatase